MQDNNSCLLIDPQCDGGAVDSLVRLKLSVVFIRRGLRTKNIAGGCRTAIMLIDAQNVNLGLNSQIALSDEF